MRKIFVSDCAKKIWRIVENCSLFMKITLPDRLNNVVNLFEKKRDEFASDF